MRDYQLKHEFRNHETIPVSRLLIQQLGQPGTLIAQRSATNKSAPGAWHAVGGKTPDMLAGAYREIEEELGIQSQQIIICAEPIFEFRQSKYLNRFYKCLVHPNAAIALDTENSAAEFIQNPLDLLIRHIAFGHRRLLLQYMMERAAIEAQFREPETWQDQLMHKMFEMLHGYDLVMSQFDLRSAKTPLAYDFDVYQRLQQEDPSIADFRPMLKPVSIRWESHYQLLWQSFAAPIFHLIHSGMNQNDSMDRDDMTMIRTMGHLSMGELVPWLEAIEGYYPGYTGLSVVES